MPSNYTGSIAPPVGQDGPQPGPGVVPIASLPVDADALNAASTYQPWKSHADFIAYLQSSAKFWPTQSPSASFTAVSHVGGGTGTVTPSGASNGGLYVVVKISQSGGLNVGKFEFSVDGGGTYGASTTIPVGGIYTDASGVIVTFAGTFTLNDTYAFFTMDTPQARWVDSAGNVRHLIDHNGFPMGRRSEFREEWIWKPTVPASTGAAQLNNPVWVAATTANASIAGTGGQDNTYPSNAVIIDPGSANTNSAYLQTTNPVGFPGDDVVMVLEFEVSLSVVGGNNTTWGFGWNSDVDPTNQDTESIRITKQSADTNWQFYTATGGGHTIIDTGITPVVDTFDRIKLEFHGKNTAVGVASVEGVGINTFKTRCFINEKHVATIGTNSPIAQTNLTFAGYCTGVSTCVASIGPLLVTWNRYLSLPSL